MTSFELSMSGRSDCRSVIRSAALVSVAVLAGCASSTGLSWVNEPRSATEPVTNSSQPSIPAPADLEPVADSRPRLNHTVTLGSIDAPTADRGAGSANAAPGGPSVVINNYNVMNVATPTYGYGFANLGYGRAPLSIPTGSAPRSNAPALTPGQSWPTISDHGPSFPYRSSPAAPWGRAQ
jgi:hypothetical protein